MAEIKGINRTNDYLFKRIFGSGEILNDDLEIHFLELKKIIKLKRKPQNDLEEWLLYLNNIQGEEMEEIAMGNPGIRKALTMSRFS